MHRSMQRTVLGIAILLGIAALTGPASAGPRTIVTPAGDVLVVEEVVSAPGAASTALRVTRYRGAAPASVSIVPATADAAFDAFPALVLDPESQLPTLVWSRHNGTDYDLVLSRLEPGGWSAPLPLVATPSDEIGATVFAAPRGIHVLWTQPDEPGILHYALARAESGVFLRGPERIGFLVRGAGSARTEGTVDDPGLNPYVPPPSGDTKCSGTGMCKGGSGGGVESTPTVCDPVAGTCPVSPAPPAAADRCGTVSVILAHRAGACVWTLRDAGWQRGVCIPAERLGRVEDLRQAIEKRATSSCNP